MERNKVTSFAEYKALYELSEEELEEMFPDTCYLMYYPTRGHEESNLPWWICGLELKTFIKVNKEATKKFQNALLWGKPEST